MREREESGVLGPASGQGEQGRHGARWMHRLLAGGFLLMILLLCADGIIGFRSILSIRERVSRQTQSQFRNVALIDEAQRMQSSLGSVLYGLLAGEAGADRTRLEQGLDSIERSFKALFASVPADDPDLGLWRDLERVSADVTREADRILSAPGSRRADLRQLMEARARLLAATSALIRANHERAEQINRQIEDIATKQLVEDATLLSACLLIAGACAWLVLRAASRLQRQITEQAAELGRVSWQLMERQENLARSLSHELHDELGQSLTALKTNFARFQNSGVVDAQWAEDCGGLLKEAIRSTHEISQLLRPTILDDFGLDSALAWLCDRFEERNRIEVVYRGTVNERLPAQTETHVFRIAQEALTNVAKHAGATQVEMTLRREGEQIVFRVTDNGSGFTESVKLPATQFGVTGMKARARSLGGMARVFGAPGGGTIVEVVFPWKAAVYEEDHSHTAG